MLDRGRPAPEGWLETFPSTQAVFDKAIELASYRNLDIDERMVRRRECDTRSSGAWNTWTCLKPFRVVSSLPPIF